MTMPLDLFLVRHGESERNLANRAAHGGDVSYFTQEFISRPTSLARLTPEGRKQAAAAGAWLREHAGLHAVEDRYFTSSYVRAAETAALLGLPGAQWRRLNKLRERSAGDWEHVSAPERRRLLDQYPVKHYELDPYNWPPPNGETLAQVEEGRIFSFLDTLHRKCANRKVVVVCHGEVLLVFRVNLERMADEAFRRYTGPRIRITACTTASSSITPGGRPMILWLIRRAHFGWMRIVCPWDMTLSSNEWSPIHRETFSNEKLPRACRSASHDDPRFRRFP